MPTDNNCCHTFFSSSVSLHLYKSKKCAKQCFLTQLFLSHRFVRGFRNKKRGNLSKETLFIVNINEREVVKQLQDISPDCIVAVAFGQFLSNQIINLPRYQCINIHASLLPKFRGAAPVNWAIRSEEHTSELQSPT